MHLYLSQPYRKRWMVIETLWWLTLLTYLFLSYKVWLSLRAQDKAYDTRAKDMDT